MEKEVMFQLSYGLYMLGAKDGDKINGCIVNTVTQITESPLQIMIAVNKKNYTHDMILKTKRATVSILSIQTTFDTIKNFGFQSGREADKFTSISYETTESGLPYLTEGCAGYLECEVEQCIDVGTHTMFIARVTDGKVLAKTDSLTYAYYHKNVKPQPAKTENTGEEGKIVGWRCRICGYVYDKPELPSDFICPLCKHGASDFEPIYE